MLNIKNLNKGKRKNIARRKETFCKKTSSKKGSALAETIILIAVSMVLALALFYPEISELLTNVISRMNGWINNIMVTI